MFRKAVGFVLTEDQPAVDFHVENAPGAFNQF